MCVKARAGKIKDFTGIDHSFEEPDNGMYSLRKTSNLLKKANQ